MRIISDDHRFDSEPLTRKQYRQSQRGHNHTNLDDEPLSRKKLRENKLQLDEESKRQIAEAKSKKLAHRLDLTIFLLGLGIIVVLLVLFFVN